MKKTLLVTAILSMTSALAFAQTAPVTNITTDTSKINVEYNFAQHVQGDSGHKDGFGVSLEHGFSDRLAAQYSYSKLNNKNITNIKDHQLALVYKYNDMINFYGAGTLIDTHSHNYGVQAGVIGYMPISDKINGYAKVGLGDDIKQSYQIGANYALTDGVDLNVYYGYDNYNMNEKNTTVKGLHAGIGYTF